MSLRALNWALEEAPVNNAQEHVLLLALADRADENGRGSHPFQDVLAQRGRCNTRTVRRHLAAMQARGLIVRGDQRMVAHLRADSRPVVWDLNLGMRLSDITVVDAELVSDVTDTPVDNPPVERPDNMSGRTNGVENARDVPPDNMSGRTQLCPSRPDTAVSANTYTYVQKEQGGYVTGELTTREDSPVDNPLPPHPLHVGCADGNCAECAELVDIQRTAAMATIREMKSPPQFCAYHPNGTDRPCAPCREARRLRAAFDAEIVRRAEERRADARIDAAESRAALIADCGMCDSDGFIAPTLACTHDPRAVETARRGMARVNAVLRAKTSTPTQNPTITTISPSTPLLAGEQTALEARR